MANEEYYEMAKSGTLPVDFADWGMVDTEGEVDGWTVAHAVARAGMPMPKNFNRWGIATRDGYTVAHAYAYQGFFLDEWTCETLALADNDGTTVAHAFLHAPMKIHGNDFARELANCVKRSAGCSDRDIWLLEDNNGWTVAHQAASIGCIPDVGFDYWDVEDNRGKTVRDVYNEYCD